MSKTVFERKIPAGDTLERLVCGDCGFVQYENPKIIVGVVPIWQEQVLLCTRAIEPRVGYWTVPAGFLEMGEGPDEGAAREAMEEANADVKVGDLIGVYTVRHIGQVHMFYRGVLQSPTFQAGVESEQVKLFHWEDIPWNDLAFPTIAWALRDFERNREHSTAIPGSRVGG